MNDSYFIAVRRTMFAHLRIDSLHAFDSRINHFEEDVILQEAVIIWATGVAQFEPGLQVLVARSNGIGDPDTAAVQALPMARLDGAAEDQMVAVPDHHDDPFEDWTATLASYGLRVSNGPVVPFRSKDYMGALPYRSLKNMKRAQGSYERSVTNFIGTCSLRREAMHVGLENSGRRCLTRG